MKCSFLLSLLTWLLKKSLKINLLFKLQSSIFQIKKKNMCLSDIIAYWFWWNLAWHTIFPRWYNFHDLSWCEIFFSSLSPYLLWETCYKNCTYDDGTFLWREGNFLSVQHYLKFNCVKMSVFETLFKIFNSCFFLYPTYRDEK